MRGIVVYPAGLGQVGDTHMKNYSIVRVGNEYVVQAGEKSVLKTSSRRRAARTVTDADELLQSQPAAAIPPDVDAGPSIGCDSRVTPDPKGQT
jgi:hypothetical protein